MLVRSICLSFSGEMSLAACRCGEFAPPIWVGRSLASGFSIALVGDLGRLGLGDARSSIGSGFDRVTTGLGVGFEASDGSIAVGVSRSIGTGGLTGVGVGGDLTRTCGGAGLGNGLGAIAGDGSGGKGGLNGGGDSGFELGVTATRMAFAGRFGAIGLGFDLGWLAIGFGAVLAGLGVASFELD